MLQGAAQIAGDRATLAWAPCVQSANNRAPPSSPSGPPARRPPKEPRIKEVNRGPSQAPTSRRAHLERLRAWQPDHLQSPPAGPPACLSCCRRHPEPRPHLRPRSNPYPAKTQCLPTMARGPPASQSATPCRLCTCPCRPMNPTWSSKTNWPKVRPARQHADCTRDADRLQRKRFYASSSPRFRRSPRRTLSSRRMFATWTHASPC